MRIVIHPVETHSDVILYAVASNNLSIARSQAHKYNFKKAYGSYEDLLTDTEVDFVYISLPNSFHFEWALKSLTAGKHVLLETPFTSNSTEAAMLATKAKDSGRILLEAFHWQFHPAVHRLRQYLDSNKLGAIIQTNALMTSTPDIPIDTTYALSGGSLMDMSDAVSFTRYVLHAELPEEVLQANATPAGFDPRVDVEMNATLRYKRPGMYARAGLDKTEVHSTIFTSLVRPWKFGFIPPIWNLPTITVETDKAEIVLYNAMMPHLYHYIGIKDKLTGNWRYEKYYKGGPLWKDRGETYWSTYRYQLEAFVDLLRGREPVWWIDNGDSVLQMKTIDEIYRKSGMPIRPTNLLALETQ